MLVWFQLVEKDGKPFKGSTPTSLSIAEGTNVDAFREAVKVKCAPILNSFAPSQLIVYKNKEDLLGMEEALPLKPSTPINSSLGPDEDHSLAVVVPAVEAGGGLPSFL